MTLQSIRDHCLSFPDVTEQIQWGKDLVFKIGGKMFCVATTEPVVPPRVALSFKCDDETFADLVEREGVIAAPYMAQHKWVAPEQFDTLGDAELKKLIARAYEIVKAKLASKPPKKKAVKKARTRRVPATPPRKAAKAKKAKKAKKAPLSTPRAPRSKPARGRRGR